ncbi:hypothetical protein GGX14DRAFT_676744 [Mycena pura]|uniref:Uncharacterized protein n=1 Tax=Mycena pura TaxID=153505 RepID=A0AAD6Y5U9_9AGAR|nr:hypothetical protein GGX14DRAFT_676744 [Mycena pura]
MCRARPQWSQVKNDSPSNTSKKHLLTDIAPAFTGSSRDYAYTTGPITDAALYADWIASTYDQNVQAHLLNESIATRRSTGASGPWQSIVELGIVEALAPHSSLYKAASVVGMGLSLNTVDIQPIHPPNGKGPRVSEPHAAAVDGGHSILRLETRGCDPRLDTHGPADKRPAGYTSVSRNNSASVAALTAMPVPYMPTSYISFGDDSDDASGNPQAGMASATTRCLAVPRRAFMRSDSSGPLDSYNLFITTQDDLLASMKSRASENSLVSRKLGRLFPCFFSAAHHDVHVVRTTQNEPVGRCTGGPARGLPLRCRILLSTLRLCMRPASKDGSGAWCRCSWFFNWSFLDIVSLVSGSRSMLFVEFVRCVCAISRSFPWLQRTERELHVHAVENGVHVIYSLQVHLAVLALDVCLALRLRVVGTVKEPVCSETFVKWSPRCSPGTLTSWAVSATQSPAVLSPSKGSQGFPAAWLVAKDDELIIEQTLWNNEPVPVDNGFFSNEWPFTLLSKFFKLTFRGFAPGSTIIRLYFGLMGCIIPIATVMHLETPGMVFTFAGPTDNDGKKDFYVYVHDYLKISTTKLYNLGPFASVADFYWNYDVVPWGTVCVQPVAGGEEVAMEELMKHGYFSWPEPKSSKPKKGRRKRRG